MIIISDFLSNIIGHQEIACGYQLTEFYFKMYIFSYKIHSKSSFGKPWQFCSSLHVWSKPGLHSNAHKLVHIFGNSYECFISKLQSIITYLMK